jgi:hypothetical protein
MAKKRKIGSITCNWNGERFIVPHLEMLRSYGIERSIVLQGSAPWSDYAKEHNISSVPDNSEKLIRENFPDVEIHPACQDEYTAELYNQGLRILQDCSLVLRLDYDMFLTKKDWKTFIDFLDETTFDLYLLDFAKRTINYYHDCDHGVMDAKETDPIAVSPVGKFVDIIDYQLPVENPENYYLLSNEDFMIHHMRGWKGYGLNKDWIENKVPNEWGVFAEDLPKEYGDGNWITLPKELKEKLCQ